MKNFEKNALKIANYLEDKMTSMEEEAFMQQLETDAELRKQYEDELLVSALLRNGEEHHSSNELLLQPAEEHIRMIEKALEKKVADKNQAPVIKISRYYKQIAAALIVIVLGSVFFILLKKQSGQPVTAKTSVSKTSDTTTKQITKERVEQDSIAEINSTVKV